MNIILIGFASSGKTTTAGALCDKVGFRHVDLDRVIEDIYERNFGARVSCRDVFKSLGAEGFTAIEHDALKSVADIENTVLSTGGRAPMNPDNHALLKSMGKIVYLKCDVDNIIKRMRRKGSPLTMGNTPEEIAAEWNRRDPIYAGLADVVIYNDNKTPSETAEKVLDMLRAPPP